MRRGLGLAAIGIALGAVLAAATRPALSAALFGLDESSPAVQAAVSLVLFTVSAAASYLPARRAAGLDPVRALRTE